MSHAQRYQFSINETVEKFGKSINIFHHEELKRL